MTSAANAALPADARSGGLPLARALPRALTIALTAAAVLAPLSLILYQSLLSAPFFDAGKTVGLGAYRFIFEDSDFWKALVNSLLIASGMTLIAVPMGGVLAFVMERTDLPGKRIIEPLILVPSFVSPMVLAFGYVVSAGPVGFYSVLATKIFGGVPWGLYSVPAMAVIAGLTHAPNVYIYASSALKNLGSDVEEAARIAGASPLTVATSVSLPLIMPALLFSAVLGVLPRARALRTAAGAGRPRGAPRAVDLPLRADEQARHAVVPPDGGGGDVHRRDDGAAGAAAEEAAAEHAPLRDDPGQGRSPARAAARTLEVAGRRARLRVPARRPSSSRCPASCCAPSSPTGASASA